MELNALKNMSVAQMAEIVPHTPGWYGGRLASFAFDERTKKDDPDTKWVEVTLMFTAEEPLSGQSMDNVAINRRYPHKIRVFNEQDTGNIIELGKRLRPDVPTPLELRTKGEDGGTLEQYLEQLINTQARIELVVDEWFKQNRDREVLVVKSVRKMA